jgi:hypothetical protein
MSDEEKIMWILAYSAKAFRGEMSKDCVDFADKSRAAYVERFVDGAANDEHGWCGDGPEAA